MMQLTEAGQVFLICVAGLSLWSFWLTRRWVHRLAAGEDVSKFTYIYLFAVVMSLSSLFFPFSYWVPKALYELATKPTYTAQIVGYSSEWVDYDYTDSDGRRHEGKELRHTAKVSFIDNQNHRVVLPNSIRSTSIPVVGEQIKVVYSQGDRSAQEKSMRSILLYLMALFMLFIMGYVLWMIIAYSFNRDIQPYIRFSQILIMRVIVPLGTMSLFAMLSYALFAYFFLGNPQVLPVWVVGVCGFFALMLLTVLYHILTGWKAYLK